MRISGGGGQRGLGGAAKNSPPGAQPKMHPFFAISWGKNGTATLIRGGEGGGCREV